jgi:DtxR family transcriptional regulator, Mn-dependent transcriptional regulator
MLTHTEENYIKTIYHLSVDHKTVRTNAISEVMNTTAASVSDMLKKLSDKSFIHYEKYQGVSLTKKGKTQALQVVRKHRLWEVFLVEKLQFSWDEVHELAEQLEHIQSNVLIERLDNFLGHPTSDPHGDPIPNAKGEMPVLRQILLSELEINSKAKVMGMKEHSPTFLQYLDKLGISIGAAVKVMDRVVFDASLELKVNDKKIMVVSYEVAKNIIVSPID